MSISKEEFEKLANLSMLEFTEQEAEDCIKELEEFIGIVSIIEKSVCGSDESIKNIFVTDISSEKLREDDVFCSIDADKVLENGKSNRDFFVVNRVKK